MQISRGFLLLPRKKNMPAQIFEDCLCCSLNRKATHLEKLDVSPGSVLTYCPTCAQETRPGSTALTLRDAVAC